MLKKIKTFIALLAVAGMVSSCALTMPVNATSNPDLYCIEVDDPTAANSGTGVYEKYR